MDENKRTLTEEKADALRQEAHQIIQAVFKTPPGFENQALNRLVDCMIGAAVLQAAALQEEIAQLNKAEKEQP